MRPMDERAQELLAAWVKGLQDCFGERICLAALVGSQARGEAGPESDVDVNVVLDHVEEADVEAMERLVAGLPHRELACGWLGGLDEMAGWPAWDHVGTYMAYQVLIGSIDALPPLTDRMLIDSVAANLAVLSHTLRYRRIYGGDRERAAAQALGEKKTIGHTLRAYRMLCDRNSAFRTDPLDTAVMALTSDTPSEEILSVCERWAASLLLRLGDGQA